MFLDDLIAAVHLMFTISRSVSLHPLHCFRPLTAVVRATSSTLLRNDQRVCCYGHCVVTLWVNRTGTRQWRLSPLTRTPVCCVCVDAFWIETIGCWFSAVYPPSVSPVPLYVLWMHTSQMLTCQYKEAQGQSLHTNTERTFTSREQTALYFSFTDLQDQLQTTFLYFSKFLKASTLIGLIEIYM